jgi:HAD superfamily hydrolase (TIGR01509 family)
LRASLSEQGFPLTEVEYYNEFVGYDDRQCFQEGLRRAGHTGTEQDIDALIAAKAQRYLEIAESDLRVFEDAAECVSRMARRWPIAINSGALRPEILLALRKIKLLEHVLVIVSAEDTARSKPDPEGYLLTLEALRENHGEDLEAGHCLVVEDTSAGVKAAKAAGMWVVGITNTSDERTLRAAGADFVIRSLTELTPESVARMFQTEISP